MNFWITNWNPCSSLDQFLGCKLKPLFCKFSENKFGYGVANFMKINLEFCSYVFVDLKWVFEFGAWGFEG